MSCGVGTNCGLDSVPALGHSICHGCSEKKKREKKEKKRQSARNKEYLSTVHKMGEIQSTHKNALTFCLIRIYQHL